jgi:hypothetical protein
VGCVALSAEKLPQVVPAHADDRAEVLYLPWGQAVHVFEPAVLKSPATHVEHEQDPALLNLPPLHWAHELLPAVAW